MEHLFDRRKYLEFICNSQATILQAKTDDNDFCNNSRARTKNGVGNPFLTW